MDLSLLLRGLIIGLAIAAPVGPIGVLTIRRTLANGWAIGFATGLGAATADATYGAVAAFGLAAVSGALASAQLWLRLIGGVALIMLGLRTLRAKPATATATAPTPAGLLAAWGSTVLLTLTNPATIISFTAIFAGIGVAGSGYAGAAIIVLGVLLGSATWWLLLSGGVTLLRERLGSHTLRWVNILSGLVLAAFGVVALASVAISAWPHR